MNRQNDHGSPENERGARVHQVIEECVRRRANGEVVSDASVMAAYPDLLPELAEELGKLRLITAARQRADECAGPALSSAGLHIRCPHCHNRIELVDDAELESITCPSCGSSFSILGDATKTRDGSHPRTIGHFELIEQVGVGQFGAVWMARDTELDRTVAVKIPRKGQLDRVETEQFLREARAAAQLRHPNIVSVHEVGREGELVYIVSDFVKGATLADWLTGQRLTPQEAAELCVKLAQALHHAHEAGVIHRDLKPSNIMLDLAGEPHLMDFGLAKRAGEVTMTLEGRIIGTPAYMSPEQARGEGHHADRRSDIYSLGVILFQLLTGELPFRGNTRMLIVQILTEESPSPRLLNSSVPRDLETITLKCLEKDPARRFATAQNLAGELRHYLAGEPIVCRPVGRFERAIRWAKRRPTAAALLFVSCLAVLAIGGVLAGSFYSARLEAALESETRQRQKAEMYQYFHHIALAHAGWREANVGGMEGLLDDCPADRRNWEWHFLKRLYHADLATLRGHADWTIGLAFNPDGTRIVSTSRDGIMKVWDTVTRREILTVRAHEKGDTRSVAWSPDGTQIASCGDDRTIKLWDAHSGKLLRTLAGHTGNIINIAFNPDGSRLASASADQTVRIWHTSSGEEAMPPLAGHKVALWSLAFSPDGGRLASGGQDGTVIIWDAIAGRESLSFSAHPGFVIGLAFSPDGTRLASSSWDMTVKVWDVTALRAGAESPPLLVLTGHTNGVNGVQFSPDGSQLASASQDQTLNVWDSVTGRLLRTLKGHNGFLRRVAYSPEGMRLATAGHDSTVRLWESTFDPDARTLWAGNHAEGEGVRSLAFSPDGSLLASADGGGGLRLWDVATGQLVRRLPSHTTAVHSIAFSSDGTRFVSGSADQTVTIWNAVTWKATSTMHLNTQGKLALSPDGRRLASGSDDTTVRIWDTANGDEVRTLPGHTASVTCVAFSPDGSRLASGGHDATLRIWDANSGRQIFCLTGHTHAITSVAFSRDATRLVSTNLGSTVRVWDTTTGREVATLTGHVAFAGSAAFNPDGTRVVSGSFDRTVKLWDLASGQLALTLKGHAASVTCVAFSPDGSLLATGGDPGVMVWDGRPWTAKSQVEREAIGVVEYLFNKPLCQADVMQYLRDAPILAADVRREALALVTRYREQTDADAYHRAAWAIVRHPYANSTQYSFALKQTETACRLAPDDASYRITHGMALYRAGRYDRALETLVEIDGQGNATSAQLAFLAMAAYRVGKTDQAATALANLRDRALTSPWAEDPETKSFLTEAENLIGSGEPSE